MLILKDFVKQAQASLKPSVEKYGSHDQEAERDTRAIRNALFPDTRTGEFLCIKAVNKRETGVHVSFLGHGSFELLLDVQGLYTLLG
jgi:hypothetical protein